LCMEACRLLATVNELASAIRVARQLLGDPLACPGHPPSHRRDAPRSAAHRLSRHHERPGGPRPAARLHRAQSATTESREFIQRFLGKYNCSAATRYRDHSEGEIAIAGRIVLTARVTIVRTISRTEARPVSGPRWLRSVILPLHLTKRSGVLPSEDEHEIAATR
jgi:hypothetical protein